ncbi:MAG: ATP-binding protein [Bdellovibrionota bacterium]
MQSKPIERDGYEGVVAEAFLRRMRFVTLFGALLMMLFSVLDRAVYPALTMEFFNLRLASSSVLLLSYALSFVPRLQKLQSLLWLVDVSVFAPGLAIILMIHGSEGVISGYYQGLNLVLLALFAINTFSAIHNLGFGVITLLTYVIAVSLGPAEVTAARLLPPLFFVGSTVSFIVVMTRLYAKQHRSEYEKTQELAISAERLEKALARIQSVERLKDSFVANVSHELRTPLALILGPIQKIRETVGEAEQRELAVVERNARVLLKQVNDLLDISKLDSGKMEMHYTRVRSGGLLRYVGSHFELLAKEKEIEFIVEDENAPDVDVDSAKMERVLFNLLSNAFKFTPIQGTIHCRVSADESDQVQFTVEDTGPGIPPEQREAVFDRFRQLDLGDTRRYGGTGLGLAIASEYVSLHRGKVYVEGGISRGSRFVVLLPLRAPAGVTLHPSSPFLDANLEPAARGEKTALSSASEPKTPEAFPKDKNKPLVVVVEDHDEMNRFIVESLSSDNRVISARDGYEGWQLIQKHTPDLVVTDMMMPRMSGIQLVSLMRKDNQTNGIPVVVLTAKADDGLRLQLLNESVQDYLYKPFSAAELKARVHNLIAMKRVRSLLENELQRKSENVYALAEALAESRRRLEQSLVRSESQGRAKDEFLMTVSHELRTPLTAILGWADALLESRSDREQMRLAAESIMRNARTQLRLVDDMLDMSRFILGTLSIDKKVNPVHGIVQSAVNAVRSRASVKQITLRWRPEGEDAFALCDGDRIYQVLLNLLENAIKFTSESGTVEVEMEIQESIVISVRDTGEGITSDFLPHVFERLKQADSSLTRRHGGLGLGLAISRQIIELHEGSIEASSAGRGMGSTFTVRLPRVASPLPAQKPKVTHLVIR